MVKQESAASAAEQEMYISDAAELTATELAQERKAALAEKERLTWLSHTPEQLATRIPTSVFAMGDLAGG